MTRKLIVFFILLGFVICLVGCQTVKGAAQGAAQGVKKDYKDTTEGIKKTDDWVRKNLW